MSPLWLSALLTIGALHVTQVSGHMCSKDNDKDCPDKSTYCVVCPDDCECKGGMGKTAELGCYNCKPSCELVPGFAWPFIMIGLLGLLFGSIVVFCCVLVRTVTACF
ncbi:uncharacterized protein LOC134183408 [Corticium candelabrum]|uniref:uncharacterized protein LOC134183408 n=1 Tax=Corticium candelabrum TaxID=121492 RepID=UPI002E26360A|nr:uncharacterized protein LOC134183408 [Corticium candelabrum]